MLDYSVEAVHAAASREFQAHRQFLWGLCYRMTGSAAEAEDLVHDAWIRYLDAGEPVAVSSDAAQHRCRSGSFSGSASRRPSGP